MRPHLSADTYRHRDTCPVIGCAALAGVSICAAPLVAAALQCLGMFSPQLFFSVLLIGSICAAMVVRVIIYCREAYVEYVRQLLSAAHLTYRLITPKVIGLSAFLERKQSADEIGSLPFAWSAVASSGLARDQAPSPLAD